MLKLIAVAGFISSLLSGCASGVRLENYSAGPLHPLVLPTNSFPIQAMVPAAGTYKHLRVYIEGDGHAWATSSQPSTDPTPHSSLMLRLAVKDAGPAAYLARPCQFVTSSSCNPGVWTASRFSKTEIDSMNSALSGLKSRFMVESIELVGHSGGGEIALVLAAMRDDVEQVQTLAGNVDPVYWTNLHKLTPLQSPITPLQFRNKLRSVPQRHIVGLNDLIVPPAVVQAYSAQLDGACLEVVEVNATHTEGYDAVWQRLSNTPMLCKGR
ncbi:alpha/beta fold hydrolase [Pseudomonas violetae]|uniref:Alpha/beta hydrolase n=1 Tax=Pseudomonas violetae TaxID=2915813 RepID=A0ABT0ET66_9PSED|nr:alpha/beta hydrolase [Pseudomonas violetae]